MDDELWPLKYGTEGTPPPEGISLEKAREAVDKFNEAFPKVHDWVEKIKEPKVDTRFSQIIQVSDTELAVMMPITQQVLRKAYNVPDHLTYCFRYDATGGMTSFLFRSQPLSCGPLKKFWREFK